MTLPIVSLFAIDDSFKTKVRRSIFIIDALDQGVWSFHCCREMSGDDSSPGKDYWPAGCCKVRWREPILGR